MAFQRKKVAAALACVLGVGGAALVGAPVFAQDIRVEVTGTNIRRVDVETPAPVQIITREELDRSGLQTISQVVNMLPANNNGTITDTFINGFGAGGSAVSLRGLGSNSTLVLLNGRRLSVYGLADDGQKTFVDLNQIPFDAVERIEILKDGASAIYGSDAIAGVVNIILRKDFQGFNASGSVGMSYKGDGETYRASASGGFGNLAKDKYNVFFAFDYFKTEAIGYTDRGDREHVGTSDLRGIGLPDERPGALTGPTVLPSGPQGTVRRANPVTGAPSGNTQSLPLGSLCTGFHEATANGYCLWEPKAFLDIQPEAERYSIYGKGTYMFSPTLEAYFEAMYSNSKSSTRFTPLTLRGTWPNPSNNSVASSTNVFLPVGHPDNPFNAEGLGARLQYSFWDVGGRNSDFDNDATRFVAGIKGNNAGWDWDVGAFYTENTVHREQSGYVGLANLQSALRGQGGFGYYRVGANANLNNPGVYNFIAPLRVTDIDSSVMAFDAKGTRDLMALPGGPMGLALGAEWRREKLDYPGVPGTATGDVIRLGYSAATDERDVYAFYGELNMPLHKTFELALALRYDHYDTYGGSTTPKVGFRWTPVKELLVRGTYAEGFRAPGPFEAGDSTSAGFATFRDPIRCPITGAVADCGQGSALAFTTGNPTLEPETSKSYTFGLLWEPIRDLSMGIDYWNIKRTDEISGVDPQIVLNNPAGFPFATIIRDDNNLPGIANSGTVLAVQAPYVNADKVKTDGIDIDIRYKWNTEKYGRFNVGLNYTHIFSWTKSYSGSEEFEYAGTHGPTVISSAAGTPKDRGVLGFGWDYGPWTATTWIRYVGPMDDLEFKDDPNGCLFDGLQPNCRISSFTSVDLTGSYKGFKNWEIFGSVVNLFDRNAPIDFQAGYFTPYYNWNYAQSGAVGRYFTLGVRYSFAPTPSTTK